jgi:hypothetical protein
MYFWLCSFRQTSYLWKMHQRQLFHPDYFKVLNLCLVRTLLAEILRELLSLVGSSPDCLDARLRRESRIPDISLSAWTTSNLAASTSIFIFSTSDMLLVYKLRSVRKLAKVRLDDLHWSADYHSFAESRPSTPCGGGPLVRRWASTGVGNRE